MDDRGSFYGAASRGVATSRITAVLFYVYSNVLYGLFTLFTPRETTDKAASASVELLRPVKVLHLVYIYN